MSRGGRRTRCAASCSCPCHDGGSGREHVGRPCPGKSIEEPAHTASGLEPELERWELEYARRRRLKAIQGRRYCCAKHALAGGDTAQHRLLQGTYLADCGRRNGGTLTEQQLTRRHRTV